MAKFGVTYSAYDGLELLEPSLRSIRDHVDYINVIFQEKSYFGRKASERDREFLSECSHLYDKRITHQPERFSDSYSEQAINHAKSIETRKREIGFEDAIENGVTHWMTMDVDEFYRGDELEWAKNRILDQDLAKTACKITYYKRLPIFRSDWLEERGRFHVPFFHKVTEKSIIGKSSDTFKADPTRVLHTPEFKDHDAVVFSEDKITMHHMKTVRMDLESKFKNTSRFRLDRSKIDDIIADIKSYHPDTNEKPPGRVVENEFGINIDLFK